MHHNVASEEQVHRAQLPPFYLQIKMYDAQDINHVIKLEVSTQYHSEKDLFVKVKEDVLVHKSQVVLQSIVTLKTPATMPNFPGLYISCKFIKIIYIS